ncbi:hypothetical protein OAO87_04140, partial [bacterium]|nr:hypothetical protein [bacterium]
QPPIHVTMGAGASMPDNVLGTLTPETAAALQALPDAAKAEMFTMAIANASKPKTEERLMSWEMVHFYKSTVMCSISLLGVCADVYLVAAGLDGLSDKEALYIRKYMEGMGYYGVDVDKVTSLDIETVLKQYQEALTNAGFGPEICKATAVDTVRIAYSACASDGVVSEGEAETVKKFATWHGLDPEAVYGVAVFFDEGEKALIDKKLKIIADGAWTVGTKKEGCV